MHSFDSWEMEGLSVEEEKLQRAIVTRGSDSVASARSNLVSRLCADRHCAQDVPEVSL